MKSIKSILVLALISLSLGAFADDVEKFYIIFDSCQVKVSNSSDSVSVEGEKLGLACATSGKRAACEYYNFKTAEYLGLDKLIITYEDRTYMVWESVSDDYTYAIDHKKNVAALKTSTRVIKEGQVYKVEKNCIGVFMDEPTALAFRNKLNYTANKERVAPTGNSI